MVREKRKVKKMRTNRKLLALTCIVLLTAFGLVSFSIFGINEEVEARVIKITIIGHVELDDYGWLCREGGGGCEFDIYIYLPPGY